MAPLGTKAIIYEDSDTRASWAPHGLDAWLLDPSKDHYCCHLYFVPKPSGYCISGSADLFPQHCISLPYSDDSHERELSDKLQNTLPNTSQRAQTMMVLRTLAQHLNAFIGGMPLLTLPIVPLSPEEQRVPPFIQLDERQRLLPAPLQ